MAELSAWLLILSVIVIFIAAIFGNLSFVGIGLLMMVISIVLRVIVCERD